MNKLLGLSSFFQLLSEQPRKYFHYESLRVRPLPNVELALVDVVREEVETGVNNVDVVKPGLLQQSLQLRSGFEDLNKLFDISSFNQRRLPINSFGSLIKSSLVSGNLISKVLSSSFNSKSYKDFNHESSNKRKFRRPLPLGINRSKFSIGINFRLILGRSQ